MRLVILSSSSEPTQFMCYSNGMETSSILAMLNHSSFPGASIKQRIIRFALGRLTAITVETVRNPSSQNKVYRVDRDFDRLLILETAEWSPGNHRATHQPVFVFSLTIHQYLHAYSNSGQVKNRREHFPDAPLLQSTGLE